MNPFEQLEEQLEESEEKPTLETAAQAIREALSRSLTSKGAHRPRPLSWGKRVARTHFGWSRIGEKKWGQILEIGESRGLWEVDERRRMVFTEESGGFVDEIASSGGVSGVSRGNPGDMSAFYRSAGALGRWRVLTEADWDGSTYSLIQLPWMDKAVEVPSWRAGQVRYELFDERVREDLASGAERSYCTSCKSQIDVEGLYPDSCGRICCSACNDLQDPRLRKPAEGSESPESDPLEAVEAESGGET